MMQPLTLPEVRQLERLRAEINRIGSDPAYQVMPLYINKSSREFWLNILDLALEANENKQEKWRQNKKDWKPGEWEQVVDTLKRK